MNEISSATIWCQTILRVCSKGNSTAGLMLTNTKIISIHVRCKTARVNALTKQPNAQTTSLSGSFSCPGLQFYRSHRAISIATVRCRLSWLAPNRDPRHRLQNCIGSARAPINRRRLLRGDFLTGSCSSPVEPATWGRPVSLSCPTAVCY